MISRSIVYVPPRPQPLWPIAALLRTMWRGGGDLLSLLPAAAYRMEIGKLGYSRRTILLINKPDVCRTILTDPTGIYPKNDLMVGALAPLVGDSIFVSSGDLWRRQRDMVDPAFSHMRINTAFASMTAAVDDYEARLDREGGDPRSLDLAMSELTADVICRTVFSTQLASSTAREVFDAFTIFEREVAQVELRRLIFEPAFTPVPQPAPVLEACERIRRHLGELVDQHGSGASCPHEDIARAVMEARDQNTGAPFSRKELIDQLGVFFLAGHETTASVLTWAFFILSTQPPILERIRAEVAETVGDAPIEFEHIKRLSFTRNVFRETLRLYPPITFIPRLAAQDTKIGRYKVKRGAMIMISPWTIHRHHDLWIKPHAFDPDRFSKERQGELVPGAYLPFGVGPRVCVGKAFATIEATLILARLARRYDFSVLDASKVRPIARLTTRPAEQIMCRFTRR
ncbi:MAG: cytochrome P450 [Gammaproteobacteria bacterium]